MPKNAVVQPLSPHGSPAETKKACPKCNGFLRAKVALVLDVPLMEDGYAAMEADVIDEDIMEIYCPSCGTRVDTDDYFENEGVR